MNVHVPLDMVGARARTAPAWLQTRLAAALAGGLWAMCGSAHAELVKPVDFMHKDWALQCDNTRTCRAVGYQDEAGDSAPVSIKLTRTAGPSTPVDVELRLESDAPIQAPLRLMVSKTTVIGLAADSTLTAAQARAVLPALLQGTQAQVRSTSNQTWTLSLVGLNAVLLKMDEVQGRIGTPGALIRPGTRPESAVLPPVPAPEVRAVKPVPTRPSDAALARPIFALVDQAAVKDTCNQVDLAQLQVRRLTASKVLLSLPCGMGAYNSGALLWIANDRPPYAPSLQATDGEFDADTGSVQSAMKVRGLGDCWWTKTWQFDGLGFTLSSEAGDSMCRGFAGGAWQLPVFVSRSVTASAATPFRNP